LSLLVRLIPVVESARKSHIAGLQKGALWISNDFDELLAGFNNGTSG
jgi:hypothetical protein